MNTTELTTENSMQNLSNEVITDFNAVVADAEALLKATANQGDEKLAAIRAKAEDSIRTVKARMADAQAELVARTKAAAKVTDAYVHENPWKAVGVGAGIGFLLGLLIGRR